MLEFLTSSDNLIFSCALGVLGAIFFLEVVSFILVGAHLSDMFHGIFGADTDVDIDVDADMDVPGIAEFLHIGKLPLSIVLCLFLGCFSLVGFTISFLTPSLGFPLWWISAPLAVLGGAMGVNLGGKGLAPLYKEVSTVVSSDSFVGREATITMVASNGQDAQAKLVDMYGQTHYIQIEVEGDTKDLKEDEVVIVVRKGAHAQQFFVSKRPELLG